MSGRVVHAWGYRRYILANLPATFHPKRTPQDELRYTQRKIEANLSNFSAWHCRTKILGEAWEAMGREEVESAKDEGKFGEDADREGLTRYLGRDVEFELVRQALWTDPGDQSGWLYHRWLVGSG